jgi:hypothetical protein
VVPITHPLRLLLDAIKPEHAAGFIVLNRIGGAIDLDNLADRVIKRSSKQTTWNGRVGTRIATASQQTSRNWG